MDAPQTKTFSPSFRSVKPENVVFRSTGDNKECEFNNFFATAVQVS